MNKQLSDFLRESETDPFLLTGPATPPRPGWVYRDFRPMPQALWIELLDLLGDGNIEFIAANKGQLPPAAMCRAQIWISPAAQDAWSTYLRAKVN